MQPLRFNGLLKFVLSKNAFCQDTVHFSIAALPGLPSAKVLPVIGPEARNGLKGFTGIWFKAASEVTVNTKKEKALRAAEPATLPSCHLSRFRKTHGKHLFTDVLVNVILDKLSPSTVGCIHLNDFM